MLKKNKLSFQYIMLEKKDFLKILLVFWMATVTAVEMQ